MRLPYSWLRDVVQAGAPGWEPSADELEQTLIRIGHEVEEVIPVGPARGLHDRDPQHLRPHLRRDDLLDGRTQLGH